MMKSQATRVTGGCLCGRIRYEAEAFLQSGYICHCTICRKSSGQPAAMAVLVRAGTLAYTKGEPKYYVSSDFGKRGFCSECGARLVWQAIRPEDEWMTNLDIGSLDDPAGVRMACHVYAGTQLPCFRISEELPHFAEEDAAAMLAFIRQD